MPSPDDWSTILSLIEGYAGKDARSGRHVHRFLMQLELSLGDVPRVQIARSAWRTLERRLIEDPNADVERERRMCVEAIELVIDIDPEVGAGLAPPSGGP